MELRYTRSYDDLVKMLKSMDEKQLIELFHDMEDVKAVERIADCAFSFVENYEEPEEEKTELSQNEDALEVDNLRRGRENAN